MKKAAPDPASEATTLQTQFVTTVKHRLVDLGWTAAKMCQAAGITQPHWSEITKGKKSLSFLHVVRICQAIGLQYQLNISTPTKA